MQAASASCPGSFTHWINVQAIEGVLHEDELQSIQLVAMTPQESAAALKQWCKSVQISWLEVNLRGGAVLTH